MKKILGLLICLIMAVPAFASVGVSPMRIELNANKNRVNYLTTAVEVKGDANKPVRYKVYTGYFKVNENAELTLLDKTGDKYDLSQKVRFVPSEFTIQPGKSQKLRINIANIHALPEGESRAMLYIEDINPKEYNIPTGHQGIGAQIIVKTRLGVPIYVDKGNISKIGEIEYFNATQNKNKLSTELKILSKGNCKIRYNGIVQLYQDKKLIKEYKLPEKVVAAGNSYISKENFDLKGVPEGEYSIRAAISYVDGTGKRKNVKQIKTINIKGEI